MHLQCWDLRRLILKMCWCFNWSIDGVSSHACTCGHQVKKCVEVMRSCLMAKFCWH